MSRQSQRKRQDNNRERGGASPIGNHVTLTETRGSVMRKCREATRAVRETIKQASLREESLTEFTIVGDSVHLSGQFLRIAKENKLAIASIRHGVGAVSHDEFKLLIAQLGERKNVNEFKQGDYEPIR